MTKLRLGKSITEIALILKQIQEDKSDIFVWQNADGEREKCHCWIEQIDLKMGNFTIRPSDPAQALKLSRNLTLYFKGEFESILFKQDISFSSSGMAIVKIPKEVRLIEKRAVERLAFDFFEERKAVIAKQEGDSKTRTVEARLLDCSTRGMGIFMIPHTASSFKVGEVFCVMELDGKALPAQFKAEVRYMARYSGRKDESKGYRLGIMFLSPLAKEFLPAPKKS